MKSSLFIRRILRKIERINKIEVIKKIILNIVLRSIIRIEEEDNKK